MCAQTLCIALYCTRQHKENSALQLYVAFWISFNLLGCFKSGQHCKILQSLFPFFQNSFCNAVLKQFTCSVDGCFHKHLLCCYKCFILQESCVIRQRKLKNYFKLFQDLATLINYYFGIHAAFLLRSLRRHEWSKF